MFQVITVKAANGEQKIMVFPYARALANYRNKQKINAQSLRKTGTPLYKRIALKPAK